MIDVAKCTGCSDCADVCSSGAISMAPEENPLLQPKTSAVVSMLKTLLCSKSQQENRAAGLPGKLAMAMEKSKHIMAEDLIRGSGFLLPQSNNTKDFLRSLLDSKQPDRFTKESAEKLLAAITKEEESADNLGRY